MQIKFLQSQAQKILEETEQSINLHNVACNFRKIPGNIYHLYTRDSGQKYLSMLSPAEWGASLTHNFEGSFRLEQDQSWTPINRIAEVTKNTQWAERLLDSSSVNSNALKSVQFLAIEEGS